LVKDTISAFGGEQEGSSFSFMNPIWGYDKDGTEEISILGTQPSWLSDDKFVFIESEDVSDSSADVSLSVYDYQNSNASELLPLDKFPYGVDALSNKVLFWNFESASVGITESETLLYDLETQKTISLGDDFNQSKWLNGNSVLMRKATDCEEIYNSGNYNAECPGMYDGTTLIDLNTIWTYDLTTNKATEFILTDEGDAVYDYFSLVSFK
jgi:hypothetical protein